LGPVSRVRSAVDLYSTPAVARISRVNAVLKKGLKPDAEKVSPRDRFRLWSVLPGGIVRSALGTAISVSSNGTSTINPPDLEGVVFRRFREMRAAAEQAIAAPTKPDAPDPV
jgi:hypothetical protein